MNPQDQQTDNEPVTSSPTPDVQPEISGTVEPNAVSTPSPKNNKKKLFIITGAVIALVGLLVGGYFLIQNQANAAALAYSKDTLAQLDAISKETSAEKQVTILSSPVQLRPVPFGSLLSNEYKEAETTLKPAYQEIVKDGLEYSKNMVVYTSFSTKVITPIKDILDDTIQESKDILAAGPDKIFDILTVRAKVADSLQKAADDMKKMDEFKSYKDYQPMIAALEETAQNQRLWVEAYLAETESIIAKGTESIEKALSGIEVSESAQYYSGLPFEERVNELAQSYGSSLRMMARRATKIVDEMEKSDLAKKIIQDGAELGKEVREYREKVQ